MFNFIILSPTGNFVLPGACSCWEFCSSGCMLLLGFSNIFSIFSGCMLLLGISIFFSFFLGAPFFFISSFFQVHAPAG